MPIFLFCDIKGTSVAGFFFLIIVDAFCIIGVPDGFEEHLAFHMTHCLTNLQRFKQPNEKQPLNVLGLSSAVQCKYKHDMYCAAIIRTKCLEKQLVAEIHTDTFKNHFE